MSPFENQNRLARYEREMLDLEALVGLLVEKLGGEVVITDSDIAGLNEIRTQREVGLDGTQTIRAKRM